MRFCNCSMLCYALLCIYSSFAIILMGKSEVFALFCLSSWCLVIVVWLVRAVLWVYLQFVIVVFPMHTHLLLFMCPSIKKGRDKSLEKAVKSRYYLCKK